MMNEVLSAAHFRLDGKIDQSHDLTTFLHEPLVDSQTVCSLFNVVQAQQSWYREIVHWYRKQSRRMQKDSMLTPSAIALFRQVVSLDEGEIPNT